MAAYFGSVAIGGNGFIAAFTGGIVFRAISHSRFVEPTEFTETFGTFLSLLVWVIFGARSGFDCLGQRDRLAPDPRTPSSA